MKIARRLDTPSCDQNMCPAVFLTDTGDVALIGQAADHLEETLPAGSGVGPGERLVTIPRDVLISAGWTAPDN